MLDPMMEQLLPGFVDESKEIVDRVTEHLIELEKARDEPRFDDLARGLHTLKGSAATLGLAELLWVYQSQYPGAMYSGCGGGYLLVLSEKAVPGAFQVNVRVAPT